MLNVIPTPQVMNRPYVQAQPVNANPPAASWFSNGDVGGTSGDSNNNPSTNLLSMNVGGTQVSYDIGPNTDAFAKEAYQYLGNSFNADTALLGNTIVGGQNFLAGFAAPLEQFNTQVLPQQYAVLGAQNFSLGQAAVQAESNVAQASIASSRASAAQASSSGGFCFITTATCEVAGEDDNGPTLTTLRGFRDRFMLSTPAGRRLVEGYYHLAPRMLVKLRARSDWREMLERIFTVYIVPARDYIKAGDDTRAFVVYVKMLADMRAVLEV
jgi:hypothetical protein